MASATRSAKRSRSGTRRGRADTEPAAICVVGHGPTLTAVDAGGPPGSTGDHLARHARRRRAGGARGSDRAPRLGARRASRRAVAGAPRPRGRRALPLVPQLLGGPCAASLRGRGRDGRRPVPTALRARGSRRADSGSIASRRRSSAGTVIGGLTPEAARHLGLPAGIPVVAGLVDAFASFHGARMLQPGDAIDVGGAAGGFGVYADRPIEVAGGFTTPAPLPGLYSVGGAMAATGAALDWFATDILGGHPRDRRPHRRGGGHRARRRMASSSCPTSPASARRCGIRRRVAPSPA